MWFDESLSKLTVPRERTITTATKVSKLLMHSKRAITMCNASYAQYRRTQTWALSLSPSSSRSHKLVLSIAFNWAQFVDFYYTCCAISCLRCCWHSARQKYMSSLKKSIKRCETIVKNALWPSSIWSTRSVNLAGILETGYNEEIKYTHTHTHLQPKVNSVPVCANSFILFFCGSI